MVVSPKLMLHVSLSILTKLPVVNMYLDFLFRLSLQVVSKSGKIHQIEVLYINITFVKVHENTISKMYLIVSHLSIMQKLGPSEVTKASR